MVKNKKMVKEVHLVEKNSKGKFVKNEAYGVELFTTLAMKETMDVLNKQTLLNRIFNWNKVTLYQDIKFGIHKTIYALISKDTAGKKTK